MKNKGFTLVEMLVVMAVFSIMMVAIMGIMVSSLRVQRHYLASQKLMDQTSYVMEYMTRTIRMAKKLTDDIPNGYARTACKNSDLIEGCSYKAETIGNSQLVFLRHRDGANVCQKFTIIQGRVRQEIIDGSGTSGTWLTSEDLIVEKLNFRIEGECQEGVPGAGVDQPKVTIVLEVKSDTVDGPSIELQTTVSQRDLDIPE